MSTEQKVTAPTTISGNARRIVRVAVAQLAYHAAIHGYRVDPLGKAEPQGKLPLSTLPPSFVPLPDAQGRPHGELSKRVEAAYLPDDIRPHRRPPS